ncbi:hypothetical protein U1Q18_000769, partial [Sarracenia purpurea var. burkii]
MGRKHAGQLREVCSKNAGETHIISVNWRRGSVDRSSAQSTEARRCAWRARRSAALMQQLCMGWADPDIGAI